MEELTAARMNSMIAGGEYLRAFDLGADYLRRTSAPDPEILKQHALCISRLGMLEDAIAVLESIEDGTSKGDPEIPALLGSIQKRRWLELREADPDTARRFLQSSFENYMSSRELRNDYWFGVNAALAALATGREELSLQLADEVIEECWEEYNSHGTNSEYWIPASMGEAYLIRRDYGAASRWYRSARSHLTGSIGHLKTTRTNARIIMGIHGTPECEAKGILEAIGRPGIMVFAGHRTNRLESSTSCFPGRLSGRVRTSIMRSIVRMNPDIGIASAADGSDIIFHECMQEMGRMTRVVLPSPPDHFRTVLARNAGPQWVERFDRVINGAYRIEVSSFSRFALESDEMYRLASDYMLKYAICTSDFFDGELLPLVVWDGGPARHPGGTGYLVSRLRELGYSPETISIPQAPAAAEPREDRGSAGNAFRYDKMGIYEPFLRPVMVLDPFGVLESEEMTASNLSAVLHQISADSEEAGVRILSAGSVSSRVFLILDSVKDAWRVCSILRSRSRSLPPCSMVLHAAMITMLNSSLTGTRDYYCGELAEILDMPDTLRAPGVLATMQFLSVSREHELPRNVVFTYHGRMGTSSGHSLAVFLLRQSED